jgi:hypothetical protein
MQQAGAHAIELNIYFVPIDMDEITGGVDQQAIPPKHTHIFALADEVWLVGYDDRGKPPRFGKGDQTALPGNIACQVPDDAQQGRVVQGHGERTTPDPIGTQRKPGVTSQ